MDPNGIDGKLPVRPTPTGVEGPVFAYQDPASLETLSTDRLNYPAVPEHKERFKFLHYNRSAAIVTAVAGVFIVGTALTTLAFTGLHANNQALNQKASDKFAAKDLSIADLNSDEVKQISQADKLAINGQLQIQNSVVIAPTSEPIAPTAGQLYFDKTSSMLRYYNGTVFVNVGQQSVTTIGGLSGDVALSGDFLLNGNQLTLANGARQQPATVGVTSFQGQTGAVTLTSGAGVSVNGTTVSNTGVLSVAGGNGLQVSGSTGSVTISLPQAIGTSSSPTFAGLQLSSALGVTSGGTGLTSVTSNQLLLGGAGNTITQLANAAAGQCLVSNGVGSAPSFQACSGSSGVSSVNGLTGVISVANATTGGSTITIDNAAADGATKGLAAFNATNFTASAGVINTIQNIATTSSPSFASITLTAALTVGNGGTGATSAGAARTNLGAAASGANSDITSLSGLTTALTVSQGGTGLGAVTANQILIGGASNTITQLANGSSGQCLVANGVGSAPTFQTCTGAGGVASINGLTGAITIANATTGGSTITINDAAADGSTKGIAAFNSTNFSSASGVINTIQGIATTSTPTFASLTLSSALSVGNGGTGLTTITANQLLIGGAANTVTQLANGSSGQCLVANGVGSAPTFQTCTGAGGVSSLNSLTGALTIANATTGGSTITLNNAAADGTTKGIATFVSANFAASAGNISIKTGGVTTTEIADSTITGTDIASATVANSNLVNSSLSVNAGTGLSGGGSISLGGSSSLSVVYGSASGTAVQGNVSLTCPAGTGNLTGGGNAITLGTGGTCSAIDITSSPIFAGTVDVQGSGGLTVGKNNTAGLIKISDGSATMKTATISVGTLASDQAYALPTTGGTICVLEAGNCTGTGSGAITPSGTTTQNYVPKFSNAGGTTVTNSAIYNDATGVSIGGSSPAALFNVGASNQFQVSTSGALTAVGINSGTGLIQGTGGLTIGGTTTLSSLTSAGGQCLTTDGTGIVSLVSCLSGAGGGSGGVASLNGLSGALSIANASGSGATVTIDNAAADGSTKGIAAFNAINFTSASGVINTIQNIDTTATPTFGGLTLTSALTIGNGGTGATNAGGARTNLGAAASGANSDITSLTGLTTALSVSQGGTGLLSVSANQILLGGASNTITQLAIGSSGECLRSNGAGLAPSFQTCPGGGGVTSIDGLTGVITIANSSGSVGTITIDNAAADGTTKGIATFDSTNFTATLGVINTIQGISTGSAPNFAGLTLSGGASVTSISASGQITSSVSTGTSPFVVASTTVVTNLNADLLDGLDSTAFATASGNGNYIQNGTSTQVANFNIQSASAGSIGAVIQGASGQSAVLLGFLDSAGTTVAYVDSNGKLASDELRSIGANLTITSNLGNSSSCFNPSGLIINTNVLTCYNSSTGLVVSPRQFNNVGQQIIGTVGQTSDLLQIMDSSFNILNKIDSNGFVSINNTLAVSSPALDINSHTNSTGAINITNSGNGLALTANSGISVTTGNFAGGGSGAAVTVNTGAAITVGQVIKGASSQTANLLELQNNNGTVASRFDSSGSYAILIATPTIQSIGTVGTGGTLAAGTYYYKVTALDASGNETAASAESSIATTGSTSVVNVAVPQDKGAASFRVYRGTSSGGENTYFVLDRSGTFTDTGAAGTAGTPPSTTSNSAIAAGLNNGNLQGGGLYLDARFDGSDAGGIYFLNGNGSGYTEGIYFDHNATSLVTIATQINGSLSINHTTSGSLTDYIQGNVSQLTDLFQLRDSSANVNASFNSTGAQLTLGRIASSGTVTQGKILLSDGTTDNFSATIQSGTLTASRTITLPDATGTVCLDSGNCGVPAGSANYIQNTTSTQTNANINIRATAGTVAVTIRGASGQNIIDFLDSNLNAVANIDQNGYYNGLGSTLTNDFGGGSGTAQTINASTPNSGFSGAIVNAQQINLTGTPNNFSANVLTGINFASVTPELNNTFYGLVFGTGYNNILTVNGSNLISGTGKFQDAGFDSSVNYSNLQNVTNLTATGTLTASAGITVTGSGAGSGNAALINTGAATNRGLLIKGAASQSAPLIEVEDSTNTLVFSVDAFGNVFGQQISSNDTILANAYSSTHSALNVIHAGTGATAPVATFKNGTTPGAGADIIQLQDVAGNINGAFNNTGSQLTLGRIAASGTVTQGKIVLSDGTTDNFGITLQSATLTASRTITLPNESGTICIQSSSNCGFLTGSAASYIQNQNAGQQATSNFWISGTARADTSVLTPLVDTATGVALNIGTTNATTINLNQNTTLAAGKSLTITGSGTRPGSPTEGMVYYDTTTKHLLVYANGKWQADRTDAVLVAASNSSQADKDAADYIADGNTGVAADGDQVQINSALTAASGKKVVLLAGTFVADAPITIPNSTVLAGVGTGTLIELADLDATATLIENTDKVNGTSIAIRDLKLDGRSDLNTAGTQYGIHLDTMGSGTGASAKQGARISNITVTRFRNVGIYLDFSSNNILSGVIVQNSSEGITIYTASNNTVTGSSSFGNSLYGISLNNATNNVITGNTIESSYNGITILNSASAGNTISGNTISGAMDRGIYADGTNNALSGNTIAITGSSTAGIYFSGSNSTITGNKIHNAGGTALNQGIYLNNADSNTIAGNSITDTSATGTNYAIDISNAGSDTNYIADNTLGTGNINNSGTGTVFGGQLNASGNYMIQPAGTIELLKDSNITGNVTVSGTTTTRGATINTATATDDQILISITAGGAARFDGTVTNADLTGARTWTFPDQSGTVCLSTNNCTSLGSYIQNQNSGAQSSSNFWISGTGRADTSLLTPLLDTATAVALNIGTTNATSINLNQNTSLAAGKNLTLSSTGTILLTGNATGSRPAGTEGQLYYDTTTKQLLIYANGKWQADRSTTTKIIAPSGASQALKDAADVVLTGTNDQTLINTALTAAAGGTVYLLEGTYTIGGGILVPNNTTLAGAGRGTIITVPNALSTTIAAISNSDVATGTGVVIKDLRLEGNSSNQTAGFMRGVVLSNIGNGTGSSARQGAKVINVWANNWRSEGILVNGTSANNTISNVVAQGNDTGISLASGTSRTSVTGSIAQGNSSYGIWANTSNYNTITGNTTQGNTSNGIYVYINNYTTVSGNTSAGNDVGIIVQLGATNTVTGNTSEGNTSYGIQVTQISSTTVSGNTVANNANAGIFISGGSNLNVISGNRIIDNGGASLNRGIYGSNADNNNISGNYITDTAASTNNPIDLNSLSDGNTLSNNTFTTGSIADAGAGNIYNGQNNGASFLITPNDDFALTGNAASTVSTTAGALNLQGAGGVAISSTAVAAGSSTITLQTGNASAGTAGTITIDNGTSSTGNSVLNLGNTNARTLQIGNATAATVTTINGGTTATGVGAISIQAGASGLITVGTTNSNGVTIGSTAGGVTTLQSGGGTSINYAGTTTAVALTATGNPTAGNALLKVNNNSTTPSGNLIDLQNKGTSKFTVDINGATITSGTITVGGHIISSNTSGTTTVAAGTAATCGGSPSASVSGNDTAGKITITTGATSCGVAGILATLTFANAYGAAPNVVLTAANAAAGGLQVYYGSSTTTFDLSTLTTPTISTVYIFSYQVIQ